MDKPWCGIEVEQLKVPNHTIGSFDDLQLGISYYQTGDYQKARDAFILRRENYDMAENNYYLGLAYKNIGDVKSAEQYLYISAEKYNMGSVLYEGYNHPLEKVYLKQ